MASLAPPTRATKRALIFHDTLVFLALTAVSTALLLVTLFIFRSFQHHRDDLGRRWADRGRQALQQDRPDEAVGALRTALTYRDDLPAQLLLAQALADAGHLEEANNYFLNLRETRPGDGFINLQLARLNREQGDAVEAVNYYRASIFGDWQGDGALRRREVRLELADYLATRGDRNAARDEILIAAGNTPETAAGDVLFGDRLAAIGDPADAYNLYTKALNEKSHERDVLAKAGRIAYSLGNYSVAYKLLSEATDHKPDLPDARELATLAANAHRIPELSLSRELPASERAKHILLASKIAQTRLASCTIQPPSSQASATPATAASAPPPNPTLMILRSRWAAASSQLKERTLERDATLEDNITSLINDTETGTVHPCGPPNGDDALLLLLATHPLSPSNP